MPCALIGLPIDHGNAKSLRKSTAFFNTGGYILKAAKLRWPNWYEDTHRKGWTQTHLHVSNRSMSHGEHHLLTQLLDAAREIRARPTDANETASVTLRDDSNLMAWSNLTFNLPEELNLTVSLTSAAVGVADEER